MAEENQPIRISAQDLATPQVDDFVAQQQASRQPALRGSLAPPTPFYLSPIFYLGVAGAVGAFLGWAIVEPFFTDQAEKTGANVAAALLMFPTVGGLIGLFLGATEGLVSRNLGKGLLGGSIGLALGFASSLVSLFVAGFVMQIVRLVAIALMGMSVHEANEQIRERGPRGMLFLSLVVARALAWTIAGLTVALGQGVAMRSRKMVFTGMLGGMLGGAIGGLFFDPICRIFGGPHLHDAVPSRAVGFTCLGLMAGIFVGLVEHFAKEAWLLMVAGPLAGKQFVVYKNPTSLGSSPKCDVYLFKDAAIEPRHALIHKVGVSYEIEDLGSAAGTYVNSVPVTRQRLKDGDRIVLGETVFQYSERAKEPAGRA